MERFNEKFDENKVGNILRNFQVINTASLSLYNPHRETWPKRSKRTIIYNAIRKTYVNLRNVNNYSMFISI